MKTRLNFLAITTLALPLGLSALSSALAQTNGQSNPVRQRLANVIVRNPEGVTNPAVFYFPGGTTRDFMRAVEKCFQVDWLSIAHIPEEMESVQLPTLRVPRYSSYPGGHGPTGLDEVGSLVSLYNSLAEREPQFGTLVVAGDTKKPSAVMLVPNKAGSPTRSQIKVRAFALRGIPEKDWDKLKMDIHATANDGQNYAYAIRADIGRALNGEVRFHRDTQLLVAIGSDPFIEVAGSVVAAHQANQLIAMEPAPSSRAVKK